MLGVTFTLNHSLLQQYVCYMLTISHKFVNIHLRGKLVNTNISTTGPSKKFRLITYYTKSSISNLIGRNDSSSL